MRRPMASRTGHRGALLLVAWAALAAASEFEPHPLPRGGPWFEGWFARVIDPSANRSVAIIVGSFQAHGESSLSSTWVSAIVLHPNGTVVTEQVFPEQASVHITDRGQPVVKEPPREQPAVFEWRSQVGHFEVKDTASRFNFSLPSGLRFSAALAHRVPWDPSCPNACGPEGWAARLPQALLPTHYYVHSLASRVTYSLNGVQGSGFAHQEMNYGQRFPEAWVWSQGVADDGRAQLLLTTGSFTIAGVTTRQSVVAYRSRQRHWDFRSTDLDHVSSEIDACGGKLRLLARSPLGARRLEAVLAAPPGSFSQPIYVPTSRGPSNTPGSVESYSATASIRLFDAGDQPVEVVELRQVALEFGGNDRCPPAATAAAALYV